MKDRGTSLISARWQYDSFKDFLCYRASQCLSVTRLDQGIKYHSYQYLMQFLVEWTTTTKKKNLRPNLEKKVYINKNKYHSQFSSFNYLQTSVWRGLLSSALFKRGKRPLTGNKSAGSKRLSGDACVRISVVVSIQLILLQVGELILTVLSRKVCRWFRLSLNFLEFYFYVVHLITFNCQIIIPVGTYYH